MAGADNSNQGGQQGQQGQQGKQAKPKLIAVMRAPKGVNGISIGGTFYEADAKGIVELPVHLAHEAKSHGFVDE